MRILLFYLATVLGAASQCISIRCNSTATTTPCSNCSECRNLATSYCLSSRLLRCGCATGVPNDCYRVNTPLADDYKVCKVRENSVYRRRHFFQYNQFIFTETAIVPSPTVHPHGTTSVSVVVPRFFNESPFDTLKPSRLMLLADFATKKPPICEDHPSITAQKWGKNHCTLRVRLAMPGIDYKSDDHYYYDDQSPLEAEFSTDMFEKAEYVRFFVQINVERHLKLAREIVVFTALLRSDAVNHKLIRSPSTATHTTSQITRSNATIQ